MILLVLSFEYDDESKVVCALKPGHTSLSVLGISADRIAASWPSGGMVRAFYEHASAPVRSESTSLEDFRVDLQMTFRVATKGGHVSPELSEWLGEIDPNIEDIEASDYVIKCGTGIRFYRPDGPRGSWVWKDTVKTVTAIIKP